MASEEGAKRATDKCGNLTSYISRQDIIKQIGITEYESAIRHGELTLIKNNGRNARISIKE
jgi:hypothetical protein